MRQRLDVEASFSVAGFGYSTNTVSYITYQSVSPSSGNSSTGSTNNSGDSDSNDDPTKEMLFIILGVSCSVLVVSVILLFTCWWRKRLRSQQHQRQVSEGRRNREEVDMNVFQQPQSLYREHLLAAFNAAPSDDSSNNVRSSYHPSLSSMHYFSAPTPQPLLFQSPPAYLPPAGPAVHQPITQDA